jgi:L-cysteine:1D-myo-inositol 2-amino-2-deoxy-alpha-D-glucopyranoside ligase
VLVSRLRADGVDPMAVRLAILGHHYRSDWEWTDADLTRAQTRLASWRDAVGSATRDQAEALGADVRAALADDLDAPMALAAVDAFVAGTTGSGSGNGGGAGTDLVRDLLDARLGILL